MEGAEKVDEASADAAQRDGGATTARGGEARGELGVQLAGEASSELAADLAEISARLRRLHDELAARVPVLDRRPGRRDEARPSPDGTEPPRRRFS